MASPSTPGATAPSASPLERGSFQYFQNARSRWQSSPRKKLSPMPERTTPPLKNVVPPLFASRVAATTVDKDKTSYVQQAKERKSVAELHVKALVSKNLFQKEPAAASSDGAAVDTKRDVSSQKEPAAHESTTTIKNVPSKMETKISYRERLIAFYKQHNPSKLDTVDATLAKFAGKEEELFDKLDKKYVQSSGMPFPSGEGPTCFLEFEYGQNKGRVEVKLFADKTPLAAENFRALCTGELGMGRSTKPLCYRNCGMHRIVENFVIQGGDFTKGDGTGGESIYPPNSEHGDFWGKFKDERFMQHNQKGLLSMANNGANRNSSQFFITLGALPSLNGKHVVFGKVTSGMEIVEQISKLPTDKQQRPLERVIISDCGEIRDGKDIRASEQVAATSSSGLSTASPFGFTACKPTPAFGSSSKESPFSVATSSATKPATFGSSTTKPMPVFGSSSKESPFSVTASSTAKPAAFGSSTSQESPFSAAAPTSVQPAVFGSSAMNKSPFSFSSSTSKPFGGAAPAAATPFSFSALASQAAEAPTASFNFSTSLANPGPTSDAADDSTTSSSSTDNSASSDESEDYGAVGSARPFGFGATQATTPASSSFSFATNKSAASIAPFSFTAPTLSSPSSTSLSGSTTQKDNPFSLSTMTVDDSKKPVGETATPVLDQEDSSHASSDESSRAESDYSTDEENEDDVYDVSTAAHVSDDDNEEDEPKGTATDPSPGVAAVDLNSPVKETVVAPNAAEGQSEAEAPNTEETWQVSLMKEPSSDADESSNEGGTESDTSSSSSTDDESPPSKSNVSSATTPRRIVTASLSRAKANQCKPPADKKPAANPFAGVNFADKVKSDYSEQLKKLALVGSKSTDPSDVASSAGISEIESGASSDSASPRDAAASTSSPDQSKDSTAEKLSFVFGFGNAVGQTNATTAKLPTPDNPFATFSVNKTSAPPASSFSFGSTATSGTTNPLSTQAKSDDAPEQSTYTFGS